jgi:hypothetical protein
MLPPSFEYNRAMPNENNENNDTKHSLKEQIESEIRLSGFPLEMYALNVCSQWKTGRQPSVRYDFNGKVNKIDLLVHFGNLPNSRAKSLQGLQNTTTTLVIECKKSSNRPWVFFSSPLYSFSDLSSLVRFDTRLEPFLIASGREKLQERILKGLSAGHFGDSQIPRCVAYYEACGKKDQPSAIYKAIDSVMNYIEYRRSKWEE